MKCFEFPIVDTMSAYFFAPIRDKKDIIRILINSLKYISSISPQKSLPAFNDKIILYINKMSRIFYVSDKKLFSIQLPFTIIDDVDGFDIIHKATDISINSKTTSFFLSVLERTYENDIETLDDFYTIFIEELEAFEIDFSENNSYWTVIKYLWTFEPGYLRYDIDQEHENGHIHPVNHLDIFYSNANTFKLGLQTEIDIDYFIDILNTSTNSKYIVNA